jgi:hypothetical protein
VASDVWRSVPAPIRWVIKKFMISAEDGAATTLHCVSHTNIAGETGLYYDKCMKKKPSKLALDETLAEQLWQRSEAWTN